MGHPSIPFTPAAGKSQRWGGTQGLPQVSGWSAESSLVRHWGENPTPLRIEQLIGCSFGSPPTVIDETVRHCPVGLRRFPYALPDPAASRDWRHHGR